MYSLSLYIYIHIRSKWVTHTHWCILSVSVLQELCNDRVLAAVNVLRLLFFNIFYSYYLCLLLSPEMLHANVADLFYLYIRQTSILLAFWHPAVPAHNIISLRNLQTRSSYVNLYNSNPPHFKFVNCTRNINDFQRLTQNSVMPSANLWNRV